VPILFFFSGVHADYHRPSDEPSKLKYEKAARIARLIYLLGLEVANADGHPVWDPAAYRRVVEGAGDWRRAGAASGARGNVRPVVLASSGRTTNCRSAAICLDWHGSMGGSRTVPAPWRASG
jgi:hypothetical protein